MTVANWKWCSCSSLFELESQLVADYQKARKSVLQTASGARCDYGIVFHLCGNVTSSLIEELVSGVVSDYSDSNTHPHRQLPLQTR